MTGFLKAIGHGLLFGGLVPISLYFAALHLRRRALGTRLISSPSRHTYLYSY